MNNSELEGLESVDARSCSITAGGAAVLPPMAHDGKADHVQTPRWPTGRALHPRGVDRTHARRKVVIIDGTRIAALEPRGFYMLTSVE